MTPAVRRWSLLVLAWLVPAMLSSFETVVFWRLADRDYPLWRAVAMSVPPWLLYALLTPAIFALGRRFPLRRPGLAPHLVLHLAVALVAGALYAWVATSASFAFSPVPRRATMTFDRMMLTWYLSALPLTALAYFGVLGAGHAMSYLAESRRRQVEAARLSAQLAEARLGALRMQLHPHFLFNTLNAATVLARDGDTRGTARVLTLLGELLREVLRTDAAHHATVEQELAFLRRYLEIEQVRFADRLRVREEVSDEARDALVPAFVLQPLVENAVRHGLAPRAAGGTIEIGARVVGDGHERVLELRVRDDGAGLPDGWHGEAGDFGIGLSNTAARLAELHGARGVLAVERCEGGGTVATVRLPYARAATAGRLAVADAAD